MLNIMPATTAIMPQFIHNFIIFNDYILALLGSRLLCFPFALCYAAVFLYLTYYAHEKTCGSFNFCIMLASLLDHKSFYKDCYIYSYIIVKVVISMSTN